MCGFTSKQYVHIDIYIDIDIVADIDIDADADDNIVMFTPVRFSCFCNHMNADKEEFGDGETGGF